MTKYDPYKGLKPTRRSTSSVSSSVRNRWGFIAASAIGLYYYNKQSRSSASSGGSLGGTPKSVEFTQTASTSIVSDLVEVQPNGTFESGMTLDTSPLNVQVTLTKQERGHTVRIAPYVNGQELSNSMMATTDASGVTSVTFSSEEMNIIKNKDSMVNSVTFRIVVDGAYADSVNVVCPIGA